MKETIRQFLLANGGAITISHLDSLMEALAPAPTTHQERVVNELAELNERLAKLGEFIEANPIFAKLPEEEQDRMKRQQVAMTDLSKVLQDRVDAFPKESQEPIIVASAPAEWDPRSPEALEPTTPPTEPTPS